MSVKHSTHHFASLLFIVAFIALAVFGQPANAQSSATYDDQSSAFAYTGSHWNHTGCGPNDHCYNNTNSWESTTNEYAVVSFTGTQVKLYAVTDKNMGFGAVSIDGGSEANVDFYSNPRASDVLLWTSPTLASGAHTLKIRITGTHDGSSTGNTISLDRADVIGTGTSGTTTAWQSGKFNVDVANVVAQSNIVLIHPNTNANQSMPLGNGNLAGSVWSANGMTVQLNRNDVFPNRKSLGWVVIPGLSTLTGGSGYSGKDDLYNAMFKESGGGMTATAYILQNKDELVVDVTGANPNNQQTAQIQLWSGRSPTAAASGAFATLAETFVDNTSCCGAGASNQTFGTLAGITAGGRNVTASVVNSTTVQVSFTPNADGTFRIIVAGPSYNGTQTPMTTVTSLIGSDATASTSSLQSTHLTWWHNSWAKTGLIKATSSDGQAAYLENLRDVDLYTAAATSSGKLPGHHNGAADMFNWAQDSGWNSGWPNYAFWHWNLRMQVAANIAAGHPELNTPYFNLYTGNLSNLETWTKSKFTAGTGSNICVPEIMRFNGNGANGGGNEACDPSASPLWNALTLTSGAEVSLWVWNQYLYTNNITFLQTNYPTMAASARFLLAYAKVGGDGKLHMNPTNTHEDQWGITDSSINDVSAMKALFPAVIKAATLLNTDSALITQLQTAEGQLLDFPRTDTATQTQQLTASSDAGGADMLAQSWKQTASLHNSENDDLEPVWPYGLIGDNAGSLTQLAQRTFNNRKFVNQNDWNYDAVQAARIGDATDFKSSVVNLVTKYQAYAAGFATFSGNLPYDEMDGGVNNGVQEALVQDYDGLLRIAPAWPMSFWDVAGTVFVQGNSKVDVQIEGGQLVTAVLEAGSTQNYLTRNPWGTQNVTVVDGSSGATVVAATNASQFTIPAQSGHAYIIELVSSPTTSLPFAQVTANPATTTRSLGTRFIGVP